MGQLSQRLTRELTAHLATECSVDDDEIESEGFNAETTLDAAMDWLRRNNACLTGHGVKKFRKPNRS